MSTEPVNQEDLLSPLTHMNSATELNLELASPQPKSLSKFGEFSILNQITQTKCLIYKIISSKTQRVYALKLFDADDDDLMAHYQAEIRFLGLSHPNIVKIIDSEDHWDIQELETEMNMKPILMEYCPNGDFHTFLRKIGKLPDSVVRTYFHQLLSAIEYLHAYKVAHMDIKLENILLDENYQAKLCDFDLSRLFEEDIDLKGTPLFRAPEVKQEVCTNPAAADIYSLGIVLFLMKTGGVHPHVEEDTLNDGANLYNLLYNDQSKFWKKQSELNKVDDDPSFFSEDFKTLFISMTRADPQQRATIKDIKNSAWYNSEILTSSQLTELISQFL